MRIFVTGVGGQLGHDVMNELAKRGYEGVGSDIAPVSYTHLFPDSVLNMALQCIQDRRLHLIPVQAHCQ